MKGEYSTPKESETCLSVQKGPHSLEDSLCSNTSSGNQPKNVNNLNETNLVKGFPWIVLIPSPTHSYFQSHSTSIPWQHSVWPAVTLPMDLFRFYLKIFWKFQIYKNIISLQRDGNVIKPNWTQLNRPNTTGLTMEINSIYLLSWNIRWSNAS